MQINIYGQPNCQGCNSAKKLLDRKGWTYTYYDLKEIEPAKARVVVEFSGMRSVPIVQVDDIYIGGLDALMDYIRGVEERKYD